MSLMGNNSIHCDGFVSFRGVDTRGSLSKQVKIALLDAGFTVFYDEDYLGGGDVINEKIKEGIKKSDVHIVLLSENYADSRSCVDELEHIMDRSVGRSTVIPVFFGVKPSEVKNVNGKFGDRFGEFLERYKQNERKRWRDLGYSLIIRVIWYEGKLNYQEKRWRNAYRGVAGVKGFVSEENKEVDDLVNDVVESFKKIKDEQSSRVQVKPLSFLNYVGQTVTLYVLWLLLPLLWKPEFYKLIGVICPLTIFHQGLEKEKAEKEMARMPVKPLSFLNYVGLTVTLYVLWPLLPLLWKPEFYKLIGVICALTIFHRGLEKEKTEKEMARMPVEHLSFLHRVLLISFLYMLWLLLPLGLKLMGVFCGVLIYVQSKEEMTGLCGRGAKRSS